MRAYRVRQIYALFRRDDPEARWADPEVLRTEVEGKGSRVGMEVKQPASLGGGGGFELPKFRFPGSGDSAAADDDSS